MNILYIHTIGMLQMILHCWQMYFDLFLSNREIIKASTSSPTKLTALGRGRSLNSGGSLTSLSWTCSSSLVVFKSSTSSSPDKKIKQPKHTVIINTQWKQSDKSQKTNKSEEFANLSSRILILTVCYAIGFLRFFFFFQVYSCIIFSHLFFFVFAFSSSAFSTF